MSGAGRRTSALRTLAWVPLLAVLSGCAELRWGRPVALWLLWLIPALAAFQLWVFRSRRRRLERFASGGILPRLLIGGNRHRRLLRALLVLLAVTACVLALARPQAGFEWQEVERRGVDLVVALDVSASMGVPDAGGDGLSRWERARREVSDLLDLLRHDRIALVAFAGTALVECPLTLDHDAVRLFLEALEPGAVPVPGTDLGRALEVSLGAFRGASHPSRAILLITDGEDHEGRALAAAREARDRGVRIFALGVGQPQPAPIPEAGGGYRRDRRGEIVLSRLEESTLQRIALLSGGSYARSVAGDEDLEQVYTHGVQATLEEEDLGSVERRRWRPRHQWMVALALLALAVEALIPPRGGCPEAEPQEQGRGEDRRDPGPAAGGVR